MGQEVGSTDFLKSGMSCQIRPGTRGCRGEGLGACILGHCEAEFDVFVLGLSV